MLVFIIPMIFSSTFDVQDFMDPQSRTGAMASRAAPIIPLGTQAQRDTEKAVQEVLQHDEKILGPLIARLYEEVDQWHNDGKYYGEAKLFREMKQLFIDMGLEEAEQVEEEMFKKLGRWCDRRDDAHPDPDHVVLGACGIFLYTMQREKGGVYRTINRGLENQSFTLGGIFAFIWTGFVNGVDHMNPDWFEVHAGTYYRGINDISTKEFAQYVPGFEFLFVAFMSTSLDESKARSFQKTQVESEDDIVSKTSVLFVIDVPVGTPIAARDIKSASFYPAEKEILFSPLSKFRVQIVQKHGPRENRGLATIYLTYLGPSEVMGRFKPAESKEEPVSTQATQRKNSCCIQ